MSSSISPLVVARGELREEELGELLDSEEETEREG